VRRIPPVQQPLVKDDLPEIAAAHVDEDALAFKIMADVLAGRRMQLTIDQIGDVLPSTIEEILV